MTLFDPDDYKSPADSGKTPRKKSKRKLKPVVVSDGRWHAVSDREGPLDFCHRLDPRTPSHITSMGGVVTRCGHIGRKLLTPDIGTEIHACPECSNMWPNSTPTKGAP